MGRRSVLWALGSLWMVSTQVYGFSPVRTTSRRWQPVIARPSGSLHHGIHQTSEQAAAPRKLWIAGSAIPLLFVWSSHWRYFLAGGLCASISHALPVPLDVVKTKQQLHPEQSCWQLAKGLVQTQGWPSLWTGLAPTLWGYGLEGAAKFGVYESLKGPLVRHLPHTVAWLVCAGIAGVVASLFLCPMEAWRIRSVLDQTDETHDVWFGLSPMLLKQVPYTMAKNASFDVVSRTLRPSGLPGVPLLAALTASLLSTLASQPGDLLLSWVHAKRQPLKQVVRECFEVQGIGVGLPARFGHVGVIVTLQLLLYDWIKRLCGLPATGAI